MDRCIGGLGEWQDGREMRGKGKWRLERERDRKREKHRQKQGDT